MSLLSWFADATVLTPHGFCLLWEPGLLWLDAVSDAATMVAYFAIPIALLRFVRRRTDLPHRGIGILFVGFIVSCAITHGFSLLTLWVPAYRSEGVAKAVTGCLSIVTAGVLWRLLPTLLALPSVQQFRALNANLHAALREREATVAQLMAVQEALRKANDRLETRVAERTTDLVRSNAAISKSEARFRLVVEASPSAMIMVNAAGIIEMVNVQAERMFGHTRAELLGQAVERLIPAAHATTHPALRAGFLAQSSKRQMGHGRPLTALRKDGRKFEVEVALNPIDTEDGPMVLSAIVDISARIEIEAKLRHSQKMHAMGRIAAGVAHDFNNLLQALGGSLEMLLDSVGDRPDAAPWGEMALRATRRGSELTGRLLSYSRQQVLTARAVSVATLLRDVGELIRHLFETRLNERSEVLVASVSEDLTAFADPGQLEAALINLAVNARDAMPSGGRLRLSAYASEADLAIVKPGVYTVVSVADTGIGMDATTIERACDPFFTTKGVNGTGLGLSMVQGFARQSGGEAHIMSVPGEGTTVEIWLPAASVAAEAARPTAPVQEARGCVMLVDDSPDVLTTLGAFLRHAGLEVIAMSDGEQALAALLEGTKPDALVTDFAMPGLNGVDLVTRAREIDASLPVMIITGFHDPEVLGCLADVVVLRKPFDRADLVRKVVGVLTNRPSRSRTMRANSIRSAEA